MGRAGLQIGSIDSVMIGTESTEILSVSETSQISHLVITNDSDETVYISYGTSAVMNKGMRINASGGFFEWFYPNIPKGVQINGICESGAKRVLVHYGE